MAAIHYVTADGEDQCVDVPEGWSVMEGAVKNGLRGILADCGGAAACATCHVIVDPAWVDRLPPIGADEAEMLDFAAERAPTSRLSCQIAVTAALDGLVLRLPSTQLL